MLNVLLTVFEEDMRRSALKRMELELLQIKAEDRGEVRKRVEKSIECHYRRGYE